VHDKLAGLRHFPLVSRHQERILMRRDTFERQISKLVQYPRPEKPKAERARAKKR
jgi:hypothetical protein